MGLLQVVLAILSIALMFMLLVAPHEGGHFGLAKLFKVRVHEYSLGLGTILWSRTWNGTLYALRAIPIGGYVRLAGMEPGDFEAEGGFHSRPAWQRFLILVGGPAANFVAATLIVTCVFMTQVNSDPGRIMAVQTSGTAYAQGLRPGDSILSLNGTPLTGAEQIRHAEQANPKVPLQLVVRHPDGTRFSISVLPAWNASLKTYLIGIESQPVVTPGQALVGGLSFPVQATGTIVGGLAALVGGRIPGGVFGPNGATGPIGIGYATYQAAIHGLTDWLGIAAVLSMALGLVNLLPLPALDGGRILIVVLEALRGRPFDREREMRLQRAGMVALLALMALIAFFDVQRLVTGQFPGMK